MNKNKSTTTIYKRIVLKLGGESLAGPQGFGVNPEQAAKIAAKVKDVHDRSIEIAIVIGAGNLWRGKEGIEHGMDRVTADHMGMLGTVMNALALQDALERSGVETRVQTAIEMRSVAEPYIRLRAIRHLEKGRVVIMAAGTGNPFFTTDTAAALRGAEIAAEVLIKATKVDGVYDQDPTKNPDATRYEHIAYMDALNMRVGVLDSTAITHCMENNLPILILNLWDENALTRAVTGQPVGTIIE